MTKEDLMKLRVTDPCRYLAVLNEIDPPMTENEKLEEAVKTCDEWIRERE